MGLTVIRNGEVPEDYEEDGVPEGAPPWPMADHLERAITRDTFSRIRRHANALDRDERLTVILVCKVCGQPAKWEPETNHVTCGCLMRRIVPC